MDGNVKSEAAKREDLNAKPVSPSNTNQMEPAREVEIGKQHPVPPKQGRA
jgi:hypothetical protein